MGIINKPNRDLPNRVQTFLHPRVTLRRGVFSPLASPTPNGPKIAHPTEKHQPLCIFLCLEVCISQGLGVGLRVQPHVLGTG